jgi:signal transduction histidine kinase
MRKIALVFLLAIFVPSLVLACLAMRSLRDQKLALERQQSIVYQGVADGLARQANLLAERQHEFGHEVETLLATIPPGEITTNFDKRLCAAWPMAEVGFVVTTAGDWSCPSPESGAQARAFYDENANFLRNIQSAEVFRTPSNIGISKIAAATGTSPQAVSCEFGQLIGDSVEGAVTRVLPDGPQVLVWYRARTRPGTIFGAKLSLEKLKSGLASVVRQTEPALRDNIVVALLDDHARPVAVSRPDYQTDWKRPFAAAELGETLPHWQMAIFLFDTAKLAKSARMLAWSLGLFVGLLMLAIAAGGWLIVNDTKRQLALARQRTDFVSNVSHELKTPLTSIRMFAELLAEGRVTDPARCRSHLNVISAEASRLTRLINNVLDFSRLERGEKKYDLRPCDLAAVVRETVQTYRPQLEAGGFALRTELPSKNVAITGDRDALAQIAVNLLSNAEKYSNGHKEITVELEPFGGAAPHVDLRVLDRGIGVPKDCAEKIFEQFFRAHDSLASGVQGSGLGLTLARQIARAHGGDVLYRPREGGGSCFILRLPLRETTPSAS